MILRAENLRVVRGNATIVRGVGLSVAKGEVLGVLGPSGAGKSTLFRALAGEIAAAAGTVFLGDDDVTREPLWVRARKGISYVPQTPSVLWDLSVRHNLRVYAKVVADTRSGGGRNESPDIGALAKRVALEDRLDVRAGDLSGGERRRLELARALSRFPKVLICDEPFSGVDPQHAERLGEILRRLATEDGVAVLFADHHVAEALRICTRALLLLDGQVAVDAEPDAFRADPLVVGRYLGTWTRSILPPPPDSSS